MSFEPRILGHSGLQVGPIGLAASYGCPADCVERAFDLGVNYSYWGSMRRGAFAQGLLHLGDRRDRYHLVIQSYSRIAALIPWSIERALRNLRTDYADVLLLGEKIFLDHAVDLRDQPGGVSSRNRMHITHGLERKTLE